MLYRLFEGVAVLVEFVHEVCHAVCEFFSLVSEFDQFFPALLPELDKLVFLELVQYLDSMRVGAVGFLGEYRRVFGVASTHQAH